MRIIEALFTIAVVLSSLISGAKAYSVYGGGGMLSPAMRILSEEEEMIKSGLINGEITFEKEDFAKAVGVENDYITITALPPAADGVLYYASTPVSVNQVIGAGSLDKLTFKGNPGVESSTFRFKSGGEYSICCRMLYMDSPNAAPVTSDVSSAVPVWTQVDISSYGTLSGSDPEGDPIVYEILKYPEKGILRLTNAESGDYVYTPCDGVTGKDEFVYAVRDCWGNYSPAEKVSIEIDKKAADVVLADMDDHWAYNAALVMIANDAMDVRSVGGKLYFDPDEEISREDFVVTVMKSLGSGKVETRQTGFADDSAISPEAKGYIAAAAELGIIKGSIEDGVSVFKPSDSITRAEAAVMLNSIIGAKEPGDDAVPTFADGSAVPAWARSSIYALSSAGVFKGTGGGYISPNAVLSRGEAAQILLVTKQLYK